MTELVTQLADLCVVAGLSYDGTPPTQVSPGVWMFYATQLNESCRKLGDCRQTTHYAVQYRGKLVLG